jgi:deferrochelatase/peroxidase EfeB
MFEAPIPGQSLTDTPGNAPYERPPELAEPKEVLRHHMNRLNDPEVLDAAMTFLEMGVSIKDMTESLTTAATMQGIHTLDVGLMVAPAIHEFLSVHAEKLGIEYEEGFENKEEKKAAEELKVTMLARKKLRESGELPEEPMVEPEVEVVEEEEPVRKGLMERNQ